MPSKKQNDSMDAMARDLEAELDALVRKDLRDEFAKAALVGLIHHYHSDRADGPNPFAHLATASYIYADAMLAARENATP
jgi:hypothetical protein